MIDPNGFYEIEHIKIVEVFFTIMAKIPYSLPYTKPLTEAQRC